MYRINTGRALRLGSVLKRHGEPLIDVLEQNDPQLRAIRIIATSNGCRVAAVSAVANALVSYQLVGRGEDYWMETAQSIAASKAGSLRDLAEFFQSFLSYGSRYNRLALGAKKKRVTRFLSSQLALELWEKPDSYAMNLRLLDERLARVMRQEPGDKTIVFAVKMYYYVARACGWSVGEIYGIPIPCDRRVCLVTLTSRIVDNKAPCVSRGDVAALMSRYKRLAIEAWRIVEEASRIPCIRLDALVWLLAPLAYGKDPAVFTRDARALTIPADSLAAVARELFLRKPCRAT